MRKLAMLLLFVMTLTTGSVGASVAYAAELPGSYFFDDEIEFLNPQPLPP
jgi:hypothetical protein